MKTICPSEVARATAGQDEDWRDLKVDVRIVWGQDGHQRSIEVTQILPVVDPETTKYAIRFSLLRG